MVFIGCCEMYDNEFLIVMQTQMCFFFVHIYDVSATPYEEVCLSLTCLWNIREIL